MWWFPGTLEVQEFTGRVQTFCAPKTATYHRLSPEQKEEGGDWWMIQYDENAFHEGESVEFMRWSDVQQILDDDQLEAGDESGAKAAVRGLLNLKAEWCGPLPIAEVTLDGRTKHFCSTVTYNEKGGMNQGS